MSRVARLDMEGALHHVMVLSRECWVLGAGGEERWWTRKMVDRSVDGVDESGRAEERMVGHSVAGLRMAGKRGFG